MVKGPKFLNPADKARKEARKKELKKNKKQRQQVRSAVIESKDPEKVISDLESLDKLEFDPNADKSCTANELLLKEKRKRLTESWTRILAYYQKEDPEKHANLKKLETEYEARHKETLKEFDAIKAAQEVKLEDVFLPPESDVDLDEIPDDDPLMSEDIYITPLTPGFQPPGCPPGMPPDLAKLAENTKNKLICLDLPQIPQNIYQPMVKTKPRRGPTPRDSRDKPPNTSRSWSNQEKQNRSAVTTKSAVIESKPVIFMPKATKFVPTSVRSKINRKDAPQDHK